MIPCQVSDTAAKIVRNEFCSYYDKDNPFQFQQGEDLSLPSGKYSVYCRQSMGAWHAQEPTDIFLEMGSHATQHTPLPGCAVLFSQSLMICYLDSSLFFCFFGFLTLKE